MANTFLNPDVLTAESLMHFVNELKFSKLIGREFEGKFAKKGAKIGDSVRLRDPLNFEIRNGKAVQLQDLTDREQTMTVDEQVGVDFSASSAEFTMDIDRFSERYLQPAMRRLANEIDRRLALLYKQVPNYVGTPAVIPTALITYAEAGAKLTSLGAPDDGNRHIVLDPFMQVNIVDALKGLTESGKDIAKQYRTGKMASAIGFDWHQSNLIQRHTVGTLGGATPLTNGVSQTGASIITDGWSNSITNLLREGDIVTFGSVFAVNPITGDSTGQLRQFRVTANVNSDGSGNATIPVSPAVVTTGAYKNVTGAVEDGAAVLTFGSAAGHTAKSSPQGFAFYKEWATHAIVGLEKPEGVHMSSYKSDPDAGISLRFVSDYEVRTDLYICRFDVLLGRKVLNGDFACRVIS